MQTNRLGVSSKTAPKEPAIDQTFYSLAQHRSLHF